MLVGQGMRCRHQVAEYVCHRPDVCISFASLSERVAPLDWPLPAMQFLSKAKRSRCKAPKTLSSADTYAVAYNVLRDHISDNKQPKVLTMYIQQNK